MIKSIVIIILIIGFVFLVYAFFPRKAPHDDVITEEGSMLNLPVIIKEVMETNKDGPFVIIQVSGTENFLQITADNQGIQLDFPMATEAQLKYKSKIIMVGENLGLKLTENRGTDGTLFLDFDINGKPEYISGIVKKFLIQVYNAEETSNLTYQHWGLSKKAS